MFFFFSKTLNYLLMPLVIICASLVLSWVLKNQKWKRRLFLTGVGLLLFLSNEFIMNEVMRAWEVDVTPFSEIRKEYAIGVLLSGAAKPDAGPRDRIYIKSAADRINHSLQLYKLGHIRKILITGGSGRLVDIGEHEADDLSTLLQLMGVPAADILTDNKSRNTYESAVEVGKMLQGIATPDQCLLITSASHIRRASGSFAKAGWPMDTFSVDFIAHSRQFTFDILFIPKLEALSGWNVLIKEWSGYIMYWLAGYI